MRFAACVEYDGTHYSGWQTQKHDVRTVQEEVEAGLSKVADQPIAIVTAGRTDTGVHATHQIIHFDSDAERSEFAWCRGANRFMSHDVRLIWVQPISSEFHARFGALSRSYRFIIYNSPIKSALYRSHSTHEFRPLNVASMAKAGTTLLGEHDFTSFCKRVKVAEGEPEKVLVRRVIEAGWREGDDDVLEFWVQATAFCHQMVRSFTGTLVDVGMGKIDAGAIPDILAAQDRTAAGQVAPPHGLTFWEVRY